MSEEKRIEKIMKLGDDISQESKETLIQTLTALNSFVRDAVVQSLIQIGDIDFLC